MGARLAGPLLPEKLLRPQGDHHPAILGASFPGGIGGNRLRFSVPLETYAVRSDAMGDQEVQATLVFFESAPRLVASLADMAAVLGPRPAAVTRELTKLHEEVREGQLDELAAAYAEAGDFENAIKWSKKCIELGEKDLPDQIEQLRDELKHYEEGKPFRELQDVEEQANSAASVLDA